MDKRKKTTTSDLPPPPKRPKFNQKDDEEDQGGGTVSRVPLSAIAKGHLLSKTEFMRVIEVDAANNRVRLEVLRGDKEDDVWEITTEEALLACSTEYVEKEVKMTKTQLAERLMRCKDDAFKVVFRPVLTEDTLVEQLRLIKGEFKDGNKTDAALRKLAKKLLEVPERTMRGRLMKANTVLGYSKVDELDDPDHTKPQEINFKQVNHNNILSLTVKGIRYVLK